MRRLGSASVIALVMGASWAAAQDGGGLYDLESRPALSEQDINPDEDLIRALERAARTGPIFRFVPELVSIDVETGEVAREVVRITNTGDERGTVGGVSSISATPGLEVDTTCGEPVEPGSFCEISIAYSSERERSLSTVVVGTIDERRRSSFDVPIEISVESPPPPPEPPAPVVAPPPPPEPEGPSAEDIARQYFGAMGGVQGSYRPRAGISVISAPPQEPEPDFEGLSYDELQVETITTQDRYDRSIPWAQASLPVDRDRILTSDRVIKAVLETPVSSVMCGKTVAMVESDVYSATSNRPLISAGSRVIGRCGAFAGERVGIAWDRIITTDGRSIVFELPADSRDATGLGGVPGRAYSSRYDRYVLPVISTVIDAAAGVATAVFGEDERVVTDDNGNVIQERSARNEGIRIVTGEARGTAQQIIADVRDVREVVVVPAGSRIDIEISEDIYFDESRQVVRAANRTFEIEESVPGTVQRSTPDNIRLVPAGPSYEGPALVVEGRRYRLENGDLTDEERRDRELEPQTLETLEDIGAEGNGTVIDQQEP